MTASTVVLVGCTKTKRTERSAARDLYDPSDLFRRRRSYAEATGLPWGILSAGCGVLAPDQEVRPYDMTIAQRRLVDPRGWAVGSIQAAFRIAGLDPRVDDIRLEVHAGVDYVRTLALGVPAFPGSIELAHPVKGLQIGQQKQHYSTPAVVEAPASWTQLALAI